jgi:POT family proton-dependent oligopeptide transporter
MAAQERQRLWCALTFWALYTCFAALVEQMGSSINLFNERVVNRRIYLPWLHSFAHAGAQTDVIGTGTGFIEIRSAQLLGVTAFLLLILSPVFAWLWGYLERRNLGPSTPAKLTWSLYAMALGYAAIAIGTELPDQSGHISLLWTIVLYLFFAIASLIVGPIGLSAITRLSATRIVGFMVGLWLLGVALGTYSAAKIAGFAALTQLEVTQMSLPQLTAHYRGFFCLLAVASLLLAVLFTALIPLMRKWMHGLR